METLPADPTYTDYESITESEGIYNESKTSDDQVIQESERFFVSADDYTVGYYASDLDLRSSFNGISYDRLDNVWTLKINNTEYKVLFPKTDDLVIVDGVLINIGSSNITGVVLGNNIDLSTYFRRTFTVCPLSSSNAQNNAYRYGAHSYLTEYSSGTGISLQQNNVYGDAQVIQSARFGSAWNSFQIIVIALLVLHVLISFIGGLLKRG